MNLKQSTTYLLWCGEKKIAGEDLTPEEFEKFKIAHDISSKKAGLLFIKPEDHVYIKGQPFE